MPLYFKSIGFIQDFNPGPELEHNIVAQIAALKCNGEFYYF